MKTCTITCDRCGKPNAAPVVGLTINVATTDDHPGLYTELAATAPPPDLCADCVNALIDLVHRFFAERAK